MLNIITQQEINNINNFEKIWKIQTNIKKFQVIPIGGQRKNKIKINNNEIDYSESGTTLGTLITKTGFISHVKKRTTIAKATIPKLYSLIDLSPANKRLLYLTLIRSKLLYPIVPLHTRSNTLIKTMQIVQNRCARIITKTKYTDHQTNKKVNEKANLPPINTVLHERARNIWNNIDLTGSQRILLTINERKERPLFKSSRNLCLKEIEPRY